MAVGYFLNGFSRQKPNESEYAGKEWFYQPFILDRNPEWREYTDSVEDSPDWEVWRPQYERERVTATGLRKQAFEKVEAGRRYAIERHPDPEVRMSLRWYNPELKYENLLKRVDNMERNMRSEQTLSKYANKRGVLRGNRSLFSNDGNFMGFGDDTLGNPRRRSQGYGGMGISDKMGV